MGWAAVLGVAVALGTDAFSLAVGMGLAGVRQRQARVFALTVAVLHVLLPLAGLLAGQLLGRLLGQVAGVVGAVALMAIGVQLLWEGWREAAPHSAGPRVARAGEDRFPSRPWGVVALAGSVSLDALTVGFGLGALRVDLWLTVLTMGIVAGCMTWTGFICGCRLGKWIGSRSRILGGVLLLFIAWRLLGEVW
ncbi:MAG: manganese efflux pump [Clostridia bacterium]|jgi:putative Mn2+ efflux pump MntP|nr:manganese efflux pump MntP family protein [Clostridia bacterium]MDH7571998.1 manganese efflux pump [Clostridia bacterium]